MNEPKRVQIIRPNQDLNEYMYQRSNENSEGQIHEKLLFSQYDYTEIGWRRLRTIQALSINDNWPIIVGNGVAAISSGLLGAMITRRVGRNLLLHLSTSMLPASGSALLVTAVSHLSSYYYLVLRSFLSNDPMICTTCLEIRSFAIGSFVPVAMGTSIAVVSNFSTCLLNKTIRLPQFQIQAYPEWMLFFRKHVFKGMSQRYFVVYPLISGFLTSMVFLGQNYYWKNDLQHRFDSLEEQLVKKSSKRNLRVSLQEVFEKIFGRKSQ